MKPTKRTTASDFLFCSKRAFRYFTYACLVFHLKPLIFHLFLSRETQKRFVSGRRTTAVRTECNNCFTQHKRPAALLRAPHNATQPITHTYPSLGSCQPTFCYLPVVHERTKRTTVSFKPHLSYCCCICLHLNSADPHEKWQRNSHDVQLNLKE